MTPEPQIEYLLNETIAACDALLLYYDLKQQLAMMLMTERETCDAGDTRLNESLKPAIDGDTSKNTLETLPNIYPVKVSSEGACGFCARRVRCCK